MTREEIINFITLTLNKICEAELGQVNASKWGGKAIKTTDTKVIATELYEKGLQIVESDDVVISKYEYDFLKNNQKDGRPDGATNLLIKMHETELLKEFVEWQAKQYKDLYYIYEEEIKKETDHDDYIWLVGKKAGIGEIRQLLKTAIERFLEENKDVEPKESI